jgi:hypothetical protein
LPETLHTDGPTTEQIRTAIEARIDRALALEELSWRLHSFIEDLWGPLPEGWSTGMADLGVRLSHGDVNAGESGSRAWDSGRAQILKNLSPEEAWLVGLSEHLWDHAFDRARETIRTVAIESFLEATMAFIAENPAVPPLRTDPLPEAHVHAEQLGGTGDARVKRPARPARTAS